MKNQPLASLIHKLSDEPFRLFFPLGVLLSVIGALYWPLTFTGLALTNLSVEFHVWLQIYGFLWCFIIGFLGTALPRLTQAPHFTALETGLLLLQVLAIAISLFADWELGAHIFFALSLMTFVSFLAVRFHHRRRSPPVTFIFIPFAFISAFAGSVIMILLYVGLDWHFMELYALSRNLLTLGFVTFLLLGVGGFLIRSILGWGQALPASEEEVIKNIPKLQIKALWLHAGAALGILASFMIEAFGNHNLGLYLRGILVTAELLGQIKIHKKPISGKVTAFFLNLSLWLFLAGLWGRALFAEQYRLAFLHLCLIGGFSLTTFAIATRVILSHCGYSHLLNGAYKPFTVAAWLILIGLGARFAADFLPESYALHLAYGGTIWTAGVLVWAAFILSKGIKNTLAEGQQKSEC